LSRRLKTTLRTGDLLSRLGGDEFGLFLVDCTIDDAKEIATKLLNVIGRFRFVWEGKTFSIGASIGVVDAPIEVDKFSYLLRAADAACYQAKDEGRNRVRVYTFNDKTLSKRREEIRLAQAIAESMDADELVLVYQAMRPVVPESNTQDHYEVLVRMKGADGRLIPPMSFIPAAERYNLMPKLDEWVVAQTIETVMTHPEYDRVYAVNLSGQSLGDDSFGRRVLQRVEKSGINPGMLCFEITETAAISNLVQARRLMETLRSLGCRVALDDFGCGLSSFAYLKNLPVDYLKIDGMFIREIASDHTSLVMVDAINKVGKAMGIKTIAEFVEGPETLRILKELDVDFVQGHFIAKPVEYAQLAECIATGPSGTARSAPIYTSSGTTSADG
jgi:Amt family ammonium transporter